MEELEKLAAQVNETVEKMETASKAERAELAKEFKSLTAEYNQKFAEQQKALDKIIADQAEVQKSVDQIAIEAKRLDIQKQMDDMHETLTKKFESDEFKTYIKNFKSGSKKGVNIDIAGVDIKKATVTPSTATADTSAPD